MQDPSKKTVSISKVDEDRQIVYAEVYAPYSVDTYGDIMAPEHIEAMAHDFLAKEDLTKSIDTNHDNVPNGSYPVESFIARKNDPEFTEGAWVLGVKIEDKDLWGKVKSGEINGYSFEAMVKSVPAVAEVYVDKSVIGKTELSEDHDHHFFIELDEEGRPARGRTSIDFGHSHEIKWGTATASSFGHAHRFFI